MAGMLEGRRIIVSGCSSGNGLGAVQRMVEAGANVVGFSRRMKQELIDDANTRGTGKFTWLKLDVTDRAKCKERIEEAVEILGGLDFEVNSIHHQAIAEPAPAGRIVAWAPDGTPEGIEFDEKPFFMGVQWHPEQMGTMPQLFEAFVDACR